MIMFDNRLGYHTCRLKGSTEAQDSKSSNQV